MQEEIQSPPALTDLLEHCLQLPRHRHVAGEKQSGVHFPGQRPDMGTCLVIEIGDRQFRTGITEVPGS
jgi:hypothetical protein